MPVLPSPTGQPTAARPEAGPAVRIAPSGPFGLLLLAVLLALGPARVGPSTGVGTAFTAGLLAAAATFAVLTAVEVLTARTARRLGLATGVVVVAAAGPAMRDAEAPRSSEQARRLGRSKPMLSAAGTAVVLLSAVAALGAGWTPLATALAGAALLTFALTALELLPAPGRAGGLLLLSRHWRRTDRSTAERAVARAGIRTGWTLVLAGLVSVLALGPAGLWFPVVGWLVLIQSRFEQGQALLRAATAAVPAAAAMTPGAPEVTGWHTVDVVLRDVVPGGPERSPYDVLPLRRFDGSLSAVLVRDLFGVPGDDRDLRRAQDLAHPVVLLAPHDPVEKLLTDPHVAQPPLGLVVEDGVDSAVLGVIGPAELSRLLAGAAAATGRGASGTGFPPPQAGRSVWDR